MDLRSEARRAARRHHIDPELFVRQIAAESNFQTNVVSKGGAVGIAQFIPSTAHAMGIDPHNPVEALDGAARLMASYVHKFGNYRDALVAYNGGPGRVGKPLLPETATYVQKIMGAGAAHARQVPSGTVQVAGKMRVRTNSAEIDTARRQAIAQALLAPGGLTGAGLLNAVTSVPDAQTTVSQGPPTTRAAAPAAAPAGRSPLLELFWQGKGGINIKNGQVVPQGFVEGHADHVHVAAGPKTVVQLGLIARSMGLHVGENPHFGGVTPVHAQGSYHYKGEAIDVSGDPALMARYAHRIAGMYGH